MGCASLHYRQFMQRGYNPNSFNTSSWETNSWQSGFCLISSSICRSHSSGAASSRSSHERDGRLSSTNFQTFSASASLMTVTAPNILSFTALIYDLLLINLPAIVDFHNIYNISGPVKENAEAANAEPVSWPTLQFYHVAIWQFVYGMNDSSLCCAILPA